jgi:Zn-dependent protease with chaperone function
MLLTMFMLAAVYLLFLYALWIFGGVDKYSLIFIAGIMLFIQFFFSDKLALWSVGGRIVNEQEAPRLHEMSHVKNRDMLVITIASFLSTAAFFIVRNMLFFGMGGRDRNRSAGAALLVWLISLVVWILSFLLIEERIHALEEMERWRGI